MRGKKSKLWPYFEGPQRILNLILQVEGCYTRCLGLERSRVGRVYKFFYGFLNITNKKFRSATILNNGRKTYNRRGAHEDELSYGINNRLFSVVMTI